MDGTPSMNIAVGPSVRTARRPHARALSRAPARGRGAGSTGVVVGVVLVAALVVCAWLLWGALKQPAGSAGSASASGGVSSGASTLGSAGTAGAKSADAFEAALASAATYQRESKFPEAAAILAKLAEQAPTDQRVRLAWGQALLGMKEYAKAYAQYEAALALEPGAMKPGAGTNGVGTPVTSSRAGQLHAEAGSVAFLAQKPERAIEHYSMAQTAEPTNPRHPLYLAMAQLRVAETASDPSELESAAMASLVRATLLDPDMGEAWGTMAELELRRNHADLAAQHLEKALKLQPESTKWRLVQARVLNRQGKPEQAVAVLSGLPASDRTSKPVLKLLGESFGLLKRPGDAADAYQQAAEMNTSDAELWYQAAVWHQRAGRKEPAMKAARLAASLGSQEARELVTVLGEP